MESYFGTLDSVCANSPQAHILSKTALAISIGNKLCSKLDELPDIEMNDLVLRSYRESTKTVKIRKVTQQKQVDIRRSKSTNNEQQVDNLVILY